MKNTAVKSYVTTFRNVATGLLHELPDLFNDGHDEANEASRRLLMDEFEYGTGPHAVLKCYDEWEFVMTEGVYESGSRHTYIRNATELLYSAGRDRPSNGQGCGIRAQGENPNLTQGRHLDLAPPAPVNNSAAEQNRRRGVNIYPPGSEAHKAESDRMEWDR